MSNEWISVEDQLPKDRVEVLVWREGFSIPIQAYISYKDNKWRGSLEVRDYMTNCDTIDSTLMEPPTHWIHLPEPPNPQP